MQNFLNSWRASSKAAPSIRLMIPFMVFWNIDGDTDSPNGKKLYASNPKGVMMIVKVFEFSSGGIWKNAFCKSIFEKTWAPFNWWSTSSGSGCGAKRKGNWPMKRRMPTSVGKEAYGIIQTITFPREPASVPQKELLDTKSSANPITTPSML